MSYKIFENEKIKIASSPSYNFIFDKKTGTFLRWGKTKEDDPDYSPIGPEIADIEISTICFMGCSQCYKSNTPLGENMTFETFKNVFDKLPKSVCQIAFGIGSLSQPVYMRRKK